MKKLFTILVAVLLTVNVFLPRQADAQAPEKMSYQAVIRNSSNALVTNTQIGMEIKYRAFVLNDIHNAELLPELTEAYKNFKTLLEKT